MAQSHLVARGLGALPVVNCVSPGYLARHGTPHTLDDLDAHRLVHYVSTLGARSPGFEYAAGDRYRIFGTAAVNDKAGVFLLNRTNVTVMNGTVSAFDIGVAIAEDSSKLRGNPSR